MRRRARRILLICLALAFAGYAAFVLSPWPATLLTRLALGYVGSQTTAALAPHVPAGIREQRDIAYGSGQDEKLDLYLPPGAVAPGRPTIVWIHGGAFVAGDRQDVAPYLRILAGRGFPAVAIGYTRAPDARYPAPVLQANAALGFLRREGQRLGLDPGRIVLAGDSTGAHIAAQLAAGLTGKDYAALLGLTPAVAPETLSGTALFGGVFDVTAIELTGPFGSFVRSVLFAYFGTANPLDSRHITEAAVPRYVTEAFPPSFIAVGNGDPLAPQSVVMAQALGDRGVRVDTLFFPPDLEPKLPHQFQFDLDRPEGRQALDRLAAFLNGLSR
ncbi:alpha/beta hydrolase [Bosea sp. (in: a-proteobacteria)]|uniref:alpha/beta hydrolase n=1 Tax=Bosea sp. (in: a-proteobacteria) TaxID=1871050 RepID=UPI0026126BA7|nr:alpha/beta hydrolase [Bosea sp. (in: a-proteobacteria)]MCO5091132.1 alpha/beta hydrolase [Bosea sp. (in: a-proteobacteria)]